MNNGSPKMLLRSLVVQTRHGPPSCNGIAYSRARISLCAATLCENTLGQTSPVPTPHSRTPVRHASSSSSTRWKTRQANDRYAREAKVQGLKSRAAWKLLEINDKYRILKKGITVVDLGFAPGSWSQVAANRTAPGGRVIGVDVLPAQPPRGVSTIQGDFLSPAIQAEVRSYVLDPDRGRPRASRAARTDDEADDTAIDDDKSYIDLERDTSDADEPQPLIPKGEDGLGATESDSAVSEKESQTPQQDSDGRVVDVVLSDMSEPWDQTAGFSIKSISDPYRRMMNVSGARFRDHAGSMDLCTAALSFCFDTLRPGGHFVCKFYQGGEDKLLEGRIRRLFEKVHREKPSASRSESREGFFVALRRKSLPTREEVFSE